MHLCNKFIFQILYYYLITFFNMKFTLNLNLLMGSLDKMK